MTRTDPPPGPDSRFARAPHTSWRRIGDETVVLDQNGHRLIGLNDAGSEVWHRLDAARTLGELAAALGMTAPQVTAFVDQLMQLALVERNQGPVPAGPTPESSVGATAVGHKSQSTTPPAVTWQEPLQNAAQTSGGCAFLPGQNPLCNSAPFS